MKHWTLGFVFTPDLAQVLLIHKQHPADQKGFWNGLGGKYERNESALECISREVREESALAINDWKDVGNVHGSDWEMEIFASMYGGNQEDAVTTTDEEVRWWSVEEINDKSVKRNLSWMIPLCLDALKRNEISRFDILYTES